MVDSTAESERHGGGERGREVALLGGSFNPPHVAHIMAAYWVLATQRVAEVWLLPTYKHAFGKVLAPFHDRVRMCQLAAAHIRGVHVCTVEEELADDPLVGKTARTLEYLCTKHPTLRFALVIGSDVLGEVEKWYRWDRIQQMARIIVVARQGFAEIAGLPQLPDISSSEVRERLKHGEDSSQWVSDRVLQYVRAHRLYVRE